MPVLPGTNAGLAEGVATSGDVGLADGVEADGAFVGHLEVNIDNYKFKNTGFANELSVGRYKCTLGTRRLLTGCAHSARCGRLDN